MIEVALRHAFGDFEGDVSLRSDARVLALFGHSGAGKTSVLDAIAGLLAPREGRVAIDGEVLLDTALDVSIPVAQRRIGYVFQDGRLFPHLDVRQNLHYGMREGSAAIDGIVDLLGLGTLLGRRPAT
jgi:molybdate transport system ATP-binding protein